MTSHMMRHFRAMQISEQMFNTSDILIPHDVGVIVVRYIGPSSLQSYIKR